MYVSPCSLFLDFLFPRTTSSIRRMMMIVVFHVRVSHSKRKWQHSSTFSYGSSIMQRCLLQKSPHPSLPLYPSYSISILYVAINERLLLLLMGDVNHRCAYKTKKHVHCIRAQKKEKMRNKDRLLLVLLLLLSFLIYRCCDTHKHASRVMHVHLTLFVFFFFSLSLLHMRYLYLVVSIVDG